MEVNGPETTLRRLPPGPTRSLGGVLDYAGWRDCRRFLEIDRLLMRLPPDAEDRNAGRSDAHRDDYRGRRSQAMEAENTGNNAAGAGFPPNTVKCESTAPAITQTNNAAP